MGGKVKTEVFAFLRHPFGAGPFPDITQAQRFALLLLTADPPEDIANTRAIDAVVFGGRVLDRAALDAILEHAVAR